MKFSYLFFGFFFVFVFFFRLDAQIAGQTGNETGFIYKQELSFNALAHSQGLGLGFRWGVRNTAHSLRFLDFSILNIKHQKEVKVSNIYFIDDASRFVYGKENYVFISRFGFGSQVTMNAKPYWGGVDVRRFFSFGFSAAMTKPCYLYILRSSGNSYYYREIEKYNPIEHNLSNIYGRASFFKGFGEGRFYPGAYIKTGLSFEYGPSQTIVKYLETGIVADVYLKPIPIMAYNKNNNFFITVYVSLNFGKRYNPNVKL